MNPIIERVSFIIIDMLTNISRQVVQSRFDRRLLEIERELKQQRRFTIHQGDERSSVFRIEPNHSTVIERF